jgi:hypothetical protein
MNRRKLITAAGAAMVAAAAPTAAVADGGDDQDLVGSYYGTITATDPPLGQFNNVITFHQGGVVVESRRYYVPFTPLGPLLETSGHGAWKRNRRGTYDAFFRFLLQQAPPSAGEPLGTDNIRLSLRVHRGTGNLIGNFESNIKGLDGAIIFTAKGDFSAERITV